MFATDAGSHFQEHLELPQQCLESDHLGLLCVRGRSASSIPRSSKDHHFSLPLTVVRVVVVGHIQVQICNSTYKCKYIVIG